MWEIFSYYGMRALLVYYMTKQLLIGQEKASFIYGTYTAMAYFTPIFGGIIADRWLGKRRAVIIGGSIMAAGHFMMTFEPLFYLSRSRRSRLATACSCQACRAKSTVCIARDDPRRAWAYNVYYVGINLGGFLAPLICGTLGEFYGWHWGFGAAGVGMLAGSGHLHSRRQIPAGPRFACAQGNSRACGAEGACRAPSLDVHAAVCRRSCRYGVSRRLRAVWQHRGAVGRCRRRSNHRALEHSDDLVPSL